MLPGFACTDFEDVVVVVDGSIRAEKRLKSSQSFSMWVSLLLGVT